MLLPFKNTEWPFLMCLSLTGADARSHVLSKGFKEQTETEQALDLKKKEVILCTYVKYVKDIDSFLVLMSCFLLDICILLKPLFPSLLQKCHCYTNSIIKI